MILLNEVLLVYSLIVTTILTYMVVMTRDLVRAVILSACQSIFFSIALYCILAIDIVLVYLPVAVGIYSVVFLYAIRKTEHLEKPVVGSHKVVALIVAVGAILVVALIVHSIMSGLTGWTPSKIIRPLARFIISRTINYYEPEFWTSSPEAITATVWDYRGLDTFFEITVFYGAIVGCLALFRFIEVIFKEKLREVEKLPKELGLSLITKTVCRVVFALISIIAINIAIHGHLTPGGGFQGGATYVIGPLLIMVALSQYFLRRIGYEERKLILLRSLGLIAIALVALIPALLGGFVFQNQYKPWSPYIGYPPYVDNVWISGSIFLFNVFDAIAVATGFCLIFLVLSIPEEYFKKLLEVKP